MYIGPKFATDIGIHVPRKEDTELKPTVEPGTNCFVITDKEMFAETHLDKTLCLFLKTMDEQEKIINDREIEQDQNAAPSVRTGWITAGLAGVTAAGLTVFTFGGATIPICVGLYTTGFTATAIHTHPPSTPPQRVGAHWGYPFHLYAARANRLNDSVKLILAELNKVKKRKEDLPFWSRAFSSESSQINLEIADLTKVKEAFQAIVERFVHLCDKKDICGRKKVYTEINHHTHYDHMGRYSHTTYSDGHTHYKDADHRHTDSSCRPRGLADCYIEKG